jgi:hypothetical protein
MKVRLTKHQEHALDLIHLRGRAGDGYRFVSEKEPGLGPAVCAHLFRKGYIDRHIEIGPRGGKHIYVRPAKGMYGGVETKGFAGGDEAKMELHAIDTALIDARDHHKRVTVIVNNRTTLIGVPLMVERHENTGALIIPFATPTGNVKRIALNAITHVS